MGAAGAVTFFIIGLFYGWVAPRATIGITSPVQGKIDVQLTKSGEGYFPVTGFSKRVHENGDLRIYVLVHPGQTTTWNLQPPMTTGLDGNWSGRAQIGNPRFPPSVGDSVEVLAIAADPEEVKRHQSGENAISDPKDLKPVAQSDLVTVTIGSMQLPK
jgi:hypothetical protein